MDKKKVLFLCTGNSCRSQMAEGWAKALKSDTIESFSAGIETHGLNPYAVLAMWEAGVDISGHKSQLLSEFADLRLDLVVTVCDNAKESCPIFPGNCKVVHHSFQDPPKMAEAFNNEEQKLDCYRAVRDEIKDFVKNIEQNF